jgi:dihydroorotase
MQAVSDVVPMDRIIDALTTAPRTIFGLPVVSIAKGSKASLTLFSPDASITFSKESSPSLAYNNPFDGAALKGAIHRIITS